MVFALKILGLKKKTWRQKASQGCPRRENRAVITYATAC